MADFLCLVLEYLLVLSRSLFLPSKNKFPEANGGIHVDLNDFLVEFCRGWFEEILGMEPWIKDICTLGGVVGVYPRVEK